MSLTNPIDYTGFSSPFRADLAVNARNKADAFTKSQAALRAGALGGSGTYFLGKAKGQKFLDEAGAYAQQQGQNADMFGKAMGAVSGIGSFAAMGGFGGGPTAEIGGKTYGVDLSPGEIADLGIETGAGPGNNFMLPQSFN